MKPEREEALAWFVERYLPSSVKKRGYVTHLWLDNRKGVDLAQKFGLNPYTELNRRAKIEEDEECFEMTSMDKKELELFKDTFYTWLPNYVAESVFENFRRCKLYKPFEAEKYEATEEEKQEALAWFLTHYLPCYIGVKNAQPILYMALDEGCKLAGQFKEYKHTLIEPGMEMYEDDEKFTISVMWESYDQDSFGEWMAQYTDFEKKKFRDILPDFICEKVFQQLRTVSLKDLVEEAKE